MKAVETGWFGRNNLPEELNFKPVADAIFNGGLVGRETARRGATLTSLPSTAIVRFVLRVADHKPEAIKPLAEVKDQVVAQVKHNKAEQQAKLDAEKILVDLKAGKQDALKAAGLSSVSQKR